MRNAEDDECRREAMRLAASLSPAELVLYVRIGGRVPRGREADYRLGVEMERAATAGLRRTRSATLPTTPSVMPQRLLAPPCGGHKPVPVVWEGQEYPSLSAAARAAGLKVSTVWSRVRRAKGSVNGKPLTEGVANVA
jgi:hypothetical protein